MTTPLLSLDARAALLSGYEVVSYKDSSLVPVLTFPPSERIVLPPSRYYLAGDLNEAQRGVYSAHCGRALSERSPFHFSSAAVLSAREAVSGSPWRSRELHLVGDAFVTFDGLVLADAFGRDAAMRGAESGGVGGGGGGGERARAGGVGVGGGGGLGGDGLGAGFNGGDVGTADVSMQLRPPRAYAFESMPGFNGLGRLLTAFSQLGLADVSSSEPAASVTSRGAHVRLRPKALTLRNYAAAHAARGGGLPEERGIENVHAFTYTKTFAHTARRPHDALDASTNASHRNSAREKAKPSQTAGAADNGGSAGGGCDDSVYASDGCDDGGDGAANPGAGAGTANVGADADGTSFSGARTADASASASSSVLSTECVLVLEQFWTVNYWHWVTDALPKALLFKDVLATYPGCRLLVYKTPWTTQYLHLLGVSEDSLLYYDPNRIVHACTVLLPSPSPLDAATRETLLALRRAVVPAAKITANALALAGRSRLAHTHPTVLLQVRGGSVHGDGRTFTNLDELVSALTCAVEAGLVSSHCDDAAQPPQHSSSSCPSPSSDGSARASGSDACAKGAGGRGVVLFDHAALSVAEQVALHARADVVVAVHGAGLANSIWMRPAAQVVEVIPMDVHLDFQCGLTPFWNAAQHLGLRHHAFIAYAGRMFEPFEVPVAELVAFMRVSGVISPPTSADER